MTVRTCWNLSPVSSGDANAPAQNKTTLIPKGKVLIFRLYRTVFCLAWGTVFCASAASATPITIMVDQAPVTLNPRLAFDPTGQRIGALLFRALTRIDENLEAQPDLATKWRSDHSGKLWRFTIEENARDQAGLKIGAEELSSCLNSYFTGRPPSFLASSFPSWKAAHARGKELVIELAASDPYFLRNLSLLRYFRVGSASPCEVPASAPASSWIGSGSFRPVPWKTVPESELTLVPMDPRRKAVRIDFVRDDTTRAIRLLRNDADATQNSLSLTKTRWVARSHGDRYAVIEREGVTVSYLLFNLKDPILGHRLVRRAISESIDRADVVKNKMFGFGSLAGSFLSPLLPESYQAEFKYNPADAEKLLDQAGYPRDKKGIRFQLRFKTTTSREGQEQALLFQRMLSRVGIEVVLEVVEPAVFLSSVRAGNFQICSGRWVGVADGSILYRTLHSQSPDNRAHYSDPAMDKLLDAADRQWDQRKRIPLVREIQRKMAEDLPYFPLWYWSNAVVVRRELAKKINPRKLSLSGALDTLIYQLTE